MQTFVKRNFKTLLQDKSLCDVFIEVGLEKEQKKTFHCVGALIAVHTKKLKDKLFCTANSPINTAKSIELIESKEEKITCIEPDQNYDFGAEENVESLDTHTNTPIINDISIHTFEYLRSLFYGLNPLICTANVIGIYDTAVKYSLTALRTAALSYIDYLSIEEYPLQFMSLILDCQSYALYSMIDTLILKLPSHITHTFFTFLINNPYFEHLSNAVIEMLFFQNNAFKNIPKEYLWIAVLKWAQTKCDIKSANNSDNESESEEKREIILMNSEESDSDNNNRNSLLSHEWNSESLHKLRHFIQYFDFTKMKHLFFRDYVQSIRGLLSKSEIICVLESHCKDMISAMKSMENVIELQTYDSNYDNTHNNNTKRYKMKMYKTKEICYHSQDINLDILSQNNKVCKEYPPQHSYNYSELRLFIETNIKSLFEESDLSDVIFEIGMHKCHGIRALFAIHSPVFKSMLYGNHWLESTKNGNVILRDMTREIFACLRSFFYGFNANINHKNVIGLFYHSDKYLITPLKNECMTYVSQIDVSTQTDAFLYILAELQSYNLCSIWKSIICDMISAIDINNNAHISQFLQILICLNECQLHTSVTNTITNLKISKSITCEKILNDCQFLKLPKLITHTLIETFRKPKFDRLISQEQLWTAVTHWAHSDTELCIEFVKYFDFTLIDAEFVRDYVESVGVLSDSERLRIYKSHSIQLSDLQKRLNELQTQNRQSMQQNMHYQSKLKGSERTIRQLKKLHKSELTQIRTQFNITSQNMSTLYSHKYSPNNSPKPSQLSESKEENSNTVRFEWYSKEYLSVSKNGRQIVTIRDDCAWLLTYLNIKCSEGVHIFSIKAHECEHGYDAIGVITVKDLSFINGKHFPNNKFGFQYYYNPNQHSWSRGETITCMVDCISSRIVFKKNGIIVQKSDIEKNKIYYAVLQTCGCAGHRYEILEYKQICSDFLKH